MLPSHADVHRVLPCLVGLFNEKSVVADGEGSVIWTEIIDFKTGTFV